LAFTLPLKTTEVDLDKVSGYLKNQVGWVTLSKVRSAIPPKHADARKVDAMRYIGLIDRDGENVKLTSVGHEYGAGDADKRVDIMRKLLKAKPLYTATLDWMHYHGKTSPSKTDIANYWHEHQDNETSGASSDTLAHSAVFFMRLVAVADLGKFVAAGRGRDTHLEMDAGQLEEFVTDAQSPSASSPDQPEEVPAPIAPTPPPPTQPVPSAVSVGTSLNVNLEIHIAADAKPATVEEIFKNMRKHLIDGPDSSADGG